MIQIANRLGWWYPGCKTWIYHKNEIFSSPFPMILFSFQWDFSDTFLHWHQLFSLIGESRFLGPLVKLVALFCYRQFEPRPIQRGLCDKKSRFSCSNFGHVVGCGRVEQWPCGLSNFVTFSVEKNKSSFQNFIPCGTLLWADYSSRKEALRWSSVPKQSKPKPPIVNDTISFLRAILKKGTISVWTKGPDSLT